MNPPHAYGPGTADSAAAPHTARPTRTQRLALAAILALAFALRFHGLDQNGWGADYYTAAVRSMSMNAHNFFFAAFDPAGFLSVDKPPLALWIQVASVKAFGFRPFSVLMPQVLAGVLAVWVLFRMSWPRFGATPALLAALFLATAPVWVAVNRTNNMDSWLVLLLLLAAWALLRATETGHRGLLVLATALVGVAFNVKMLAALVVLPSFFLVYLLRAPGTRRRRLADLSIGLFVVAALSLPWPLAYEMTRPDQRPYVGSTTGNSMFELLVGHNGAGRFVSKLTGSAAKAATRSGAVAPNDAAADTSGRADPQASGTFNAVARLFVRTPTGPLRLADGQLAAQVAWLLPIAAFALLPAARGERAGPRRPRSSALMLWTVWLATYAVVYSYAGGIVHFYYLSTLAPALAVLAGVAIVDLAGRFARRDATAGWLLPAALLATAAWQFHIQSSALGWTPAQILVRMDDWRGWIHAALAVGTLVACAGLLLAHARGAADQAFRPMAFGATAIGIVALLLVPMAWTASSVLAPAPGMTPAADLQRLDPDQSLIDTRIRSMFGRLPDNALLIDHLQRHRAHERYLLSTTTTNLAAPLIIATGEPVMARGGFHGLDRATTVDSFARLVADGQVRFATIGDATQISRRMGSDLAQREIDDWIRTHGRLVDPALWRPRGSRTRAELYDLRPDNGVASIAPRCPTANGATCS